VIQTGNHLIPWEMLAKDTSKDLPLLAAELRESPAEAAFVTSEDLCLLYAKPPMLEMIHAALDEAGYRVKILIYLRPQASYLESMYVERIKHNYVRSVQSFVDRSLATGMYHIDDSPIQLEMLYTRLLAPWVTAFGRENVTVRPYIPGQPNAQIFQEFVQLLAMLAPGIAKTPLNLTGSKARANDSINFGGLLETAFMKLLPERPQPFRPSTIVAQIPEFPKELFSQRFALLTRDDTLRFLEVFGPDNVLLEREYGVHVPFQSEADVAPPEDPIWQKALLDRTLFDKLLSLWIGEAERQSGKGSS